MTTITPTTCPTTTSTSLRAAGLLTAIVLAAIAMAASAVDAVRSGALVMGEGGVAEAIPASFYGPAVLPDLIVQNVGWVAVLGVLTIVAAGIALARSARS